MAGRALRLALSEYLISDLTLSAVPLSMSCFFNPRNKFITHPIMGCWDPAGAGGVDAFYIQAAGAAGGQPIQAVTASSGGFSVSTKTIAGGFLANVWQHCGGVFGSTTHRQSYYNGSPGTADTSSRTPAGITVTRVGQYNSSGTIVYVDLDVCEIGLWNAALTDQEMALLGAGESCANVRPSALVGYWLPMREFDVQAHAAQNYASGGWGALRPGTATSVSRPTHLPRFVRHRPVMVVPSLVVPPTGGGTSALIGSGLIGGGMVGGRLVA
jgi:hypothetical protein